MKISSATPATCESTHTNRQHADGRPEFGPVSTLGRLVRRIDRLLTAIAYAEAGDLAAVKEMHEQDRAEATRRAARKPGAPRYAINAAQPMSDIS